jgi:hypothetical protein
MTTSSHTHTHTHTKTQSECKIRQQMHSYRFSRRSALGGGQACDLAATLAVLPPRSPPRSSFGTRIMAETKPKAPRCVRRMQGCPRERRSQICLACTASGRAASRTLPRLRAARADESRSWPQPPPMVNEAASVPAFREPSRGSNPRGGSRREPAVAIVAFVASEPSHGLADGQLAPDRDFARPRGVPAAVRPSLALRVSALVGFALTRFASLRPQIVRPGPAPGVQAQQGEPV